MFWTSPWGKGKNSMSVWSSHHWRHLKMNSLYAGCCATEVSFLTNCTHSSASILPCRQPNLCWQAMTFIRGSIKNDSRDWRDADIDIDVTLPVANFARWFPTHQSCLKELLVTAVYPWVLWSQHVAKRCVAPCSFCMSPVRKWWCINVCQFECTFYTRGNRLNQTSVEPRNISSFCEIGWRPGNLAPRAASSKHHNTVLWFADGSMATGRNPSAFRDPWVHPQTSWALVIK